jgi:hypothetical protein
LEASINEDSPSGASGSHVVHEHHALGWIIPGGGGVVRNIKTTDDGRNIVMAESGVNKVALVEIGASVGSR